MKNTWFIIFAIILLYLFGLFSLNSKERYPKLLEYSRGEVVPIENDFFNNSSECMNGYAVSIKNVTIMSIEDYCENYEVSIESFDVHDHICLITANFQNNNSIINEYAGIDLNEYMLQSGSFFNYMDQDAFISVNETNHLKFSLRPNSQKDFILPFIIKEKMISIKKFVRYNPVMVVSLYPNKKTLKLF